MTPTVLLIEDDADIRLLVEMTLRMHGIDVISCAEGVAGLKAMERRVFNLVILDVMMPDMSGYEVLRLISDRFGAGAPPVALFTARPEDDTTKELVKQHRVHLMAKPFEPNTLAQHVKSMMRL